MSAFDQWEGVSRYNDENSLMERFPQTSESTMTENPSGNVIWDYTVDDMLLQEVVPSHEINTKLSLWFIIRKRVGSVARDRINKKQKIS